MKRTICILLFFSFSLILSSQGYHMISTVMTPKKTATVIIDSGHGGADPGKVGIDQILEKDINLKIANYLKKELEQQQIHVIMTRKEDISLSPSDHFSKNADLRNRKELIFKYDPNVAISIHQNSFSATSIHGAQVFYGIHSTQGKQLADILQSQLLSIDPSNHRTSKENSSYYLFHDNPYPTVIVECGFLSNPEECRKLNSKQYQKAIAKQLCLGILKYLRQS